MKIWVFCLFLLYVPKLFGAELVVWQYPRGSDRFVMPDVLYQTGQETLKSYVRFMQNNADLRGQINLTESEINNQFRFSIVRPGAKLKVLLLANDISDVTEDDGAPWEALKSFQQAGADVYILPIAAAGILSRTDRALFYQKLSKTFDIVVPTGGDDVDPSHYGEEASPLTRKTNFTRDLFEIELIKAVFAEKDAFIFSICRGHQITSVALGLSLIQDIDTEVVPNVGHGRRQHPISYLGYENNLLKALWPNAEPNPKVLSIHHQAVDHRANANLRMSAISADGIVEAYEFINGQGLTTQFHPEMMGEVGIQFLKNLLTHVRKLKESRDCESALR